MWLAHRRYRFLVALAVAVPALYFGAPLVRSEAIVNGSPVASAPSWAAILAKLPGDGDGTGLCSGALIAPNLVISAKHCGEPTSATGATVGRSDGLAVGTGTGGRVIGRFAHPSVELAIYQLDRALTPTPIKIGSDDPSAGPSLIPLTVYGYGRTSELTEKPVFDYKLRTAVGLVTTCRDKAAPEFCLTPQGVQGPCVGDSGGALVASGMLVGVYDGNMTDARGRLRCVGNTWWAVSVTAPQIREWVNGIIVANPAPAGGS